MSTEPSRSAPGPEARRRLTPRIVLAASLATTLSTAAAGLLWTLFFMDEIRLQIARYTDEVVLENLALCRADPAVFGRDRKVGRFDAYDAATLRSLNPRSPAPDPVLVARLRAGEALPARVYWGWRTALGGAVLKQVADPGPCSLFQLQWYAPPGTRLHVGLLVLFLTLLSLGGAVALSTLVVVRPFVRRLERLGLAALHVGEEAGYEANQDSEDDEIGDLSRILDRAHERIRTESGRLRSREQVLERHLADISHDLRTPLTSAQIALEGASPLVEGTEARDLVRAALTDIVYTSELTENLRLATRLRQGFDPASLDVPADLTAIVERIVHRISLLGKHRGVTVEGAHPGVPLVMRGQPLWIEQAVTNIVHNAVSHGGEGGHVAVLLETRDPRRFRLTVLDDGPGGPAAPLEGLDSHADRARRRDPPGSGLALAVAAVVCRIHGWNLDLTTEESHGRRVVVEGPLAPPSGETRDAGETEPLIPEPASLPSSRQVGREGAAEALMSSAGVPAADTPPATRSPAGVRSKLWRRLTPRILLASGLAAALSVFGMGILWARIWVHQIVVGVSGYAREIAVDNFPVCAQAPDTFFRQRRVGRLDGYDAATLRSPNPGSPPLDAVLLGKLRAGDTDPAHVFWTWDGQWGGAMLTRLLPSGPCSLFQVSFRAAPGSGLRGLTLLVVLTVLSLAGTMALSTVVAVRPVVARLVRLRGAAELVGAESGYQIGDDSPADEIGRLAAILDRAHDRVRIESLRLKARQRALERRLGDIAHDLRTPLTSAHIALEQAARLLPDAEAGGLVRRALSETVYTAELTENLRLATQLREGGDPLESDPVTNLASVVERVVARFALLGRHRGVALEGAGPGRAVFVRGHPLWAEQAVANVVHNAVTHGPEGTRVAVLLEVVRDVSFCITVVDDGPGVPPTELGRLAERSFRTSQARRRDPGGSGLGLAITAEICRRSGWTLRFEPERPRGLRVTIEGGLA